VVASAFPPSYQSLISLYAGGVYYIDGVIGSDSNAGTQSSPLRTYAGFRTLTSGTTSAVMAVFKAGTYTMSSIVSNATYSECCFTDEGYERIFICEPGKVIFEWVANGGKREASPFWFRNANSRIYGGIVKRNNNGRTASYSVSWFNDQTSVYAGRLYNTVLLETGTNNSWSISYKNAGTWAATSGVYYCTFAGTAALSSYSGGASFYGDACAGNYSAGITSANFTNYVNSNGTMNTSTYAIAGSSGVYQGTYAWPLPQ
jgi:hypothetical protein